MEVRFEKTIITLDGRERELLVWIIRQIKRDSNDLTEIVKIFAQTLADKLTTGAD